MGQIAIGLVLWLIPGMGRTATAQAQDLSLQISSDKAYVGQALILQVRIENAGKYDLPTLPKIEGCDFEQLGTPATSSFTSIINGRKSSSYSVTVRYGITPQRPGPFSIPPLTFRIDGEKQVTEPFEFTALKSETGDLMFASLKGQPESVFVGEPFEVTLQIWLKPYRDPQKRITISKQDMWSLIEANSQWGIFESSVIDSRRRRGGRVTVSEVTREDTSGREVPYYLYEIPATIDAKRPGPFQLDSIKVGCSYPTSLRERRRDPFEDLFSAGRRRLSINSTRPIEAKIDVPKIEVLPLPIENRPKLYRGTIGRCEIETRAQPIRVMAGDPISFQIMIRSENQIELLQAPPLDEIEALTNDFVVPQSALSGFTNESAPNEKFFVTEIRPRRGGISEIPPIPFCYFDPASETYEIVYSDPIPISVEASEQLSLPTGATNAGSRVGTAASNSANEPLLDLSMATTLEALTEDDQLQLQSKWKSDWAWLVPQDQLSWWVTSLVVPPAIWAVSLLWLTIPAIHQRWLQLGSNLTRAIRAIESATQASELVEALIGFVAGGLKQRPSNHKAAIGSLRAGGLREQANQLESLFHRLMTAQESQAFPDLPADLDSLRKRCLEWVSVADTAMQQTIRLHRSSRQRPPNKESLLRSPALGWLLAGSLLTASAGTTLYTEPGSPASVPALRPSLRWASPQAAPAVGNLGDDSNSQRRLTEKQRSLIFEEANQRYQAGCQALDDSSIADSSVKAKSLFGQAASKYQLLIDDHMISVGLFLNAGNAYAQTEAWIPAVVNYRRVLALDPQHRQAFANLQIVKQRLNQRRRQTQQDRQQPLAASTSDLADNPERRLSDQADQATSSESSIPTRGASMLAVAEDLACWVTLHVGKTTILTMISLLSAILWCCLTVALFRKRRIGWFLGTLLTVFLLVIVVGLFCLDAYQYRKSRAVVLESNVVLRDGDDSSFEQIGSLSGTDGQMVELLEQRAGWSHVKFRSGQQGWLPADQVEQITLW